MHHPTPPSLDASHIPLLNEPADDLTIPTLTERVDTPPPANRGPSSAAQAPALLPSEATQAAPSRAPASEPLARIELELQAAGRQIVNRLVAEQLPLIEQELRQRLEAQLGQLLRAGRR